MTDAQTLAVYTASAKRYADGVADTKDVDQEEDVARFLEHVLPGGMILDLGCGPGQWAARFRDMGYRVAAIDATPAMAKLALQRYGLKVRVATFDDFDAVAAYDGVWANFSLLHAPRDQFPAHLARIAQSLRPGGALHVAVKLGTGESRDTLGRLYTYYQEDELVRFVSEAGFTVTATRRGAASGLAGDVETFVVVNAHG